MEFSGRLTAFPLGDLLQWAQNDRCTGALVIRRSEREKRIYFHAGEVVGCLSNDPAEYYGQHLVLHGHLSEDQLFNAFSGDARVRGREMDLLLLQLQKGRLALLPAPVESLERAAERRGQPALQRWWRRVFREAS